MSQPRVHRTTNADGVRYWFRADVGINPATGKRQQRRMTFRTQREAENQLRALMAAVANGTQVEKRRDTVGDVLRTWLESKRHDLKPTSYDSYERTINNELIPALGAIPVQALKPTNVKDFYTAKLAEKKAEGRDGARCVQLCHLRLRQALDEAVALGLLPRNVCASVKPPRATKSAKKVWEPDQTRCFLEAASGSFYGPIWLVIAATGMRRGEALGLRWKDIDEADGTLRVAQQVNVVRGAPLLQKTAKTEDSARVVPVPPVVIAALKQHRIQQNTKRLQAGADWQDRDLIFSTRTGGMLNPNNLLRDYYKLCKCAGLESITIHGLRHSYATLAILSGQDVKAVSEVLGHKCVDITLRLYHHVGKKEHRAVADAIGAALLAT